MDIANVFGKIKASFIKTILPYTLLHSYPLYDILSLGDNMKTKILVIISIILLSISALFTYYYFSQTTKTAETHFVTETSAKEKINSTNPNTENNDSIVVELPRKEDSHLNISVIGDIMCHNSQYIDAYVSTENTYDFSYVFTDIKDYISNADIAIGNLETTFAGKDKGYSNYPRFNTPEQLATGLKDLGIDILSTANNHCMDTNYDGLVSTLNYLDNAGISHIGTNRSVDEQNTILIKEVNNIKIAFLSFTYGTNGISIPEDKSYCVNLIDENLILNQLDKAKQYKPDLICVNMHWGTEYQTTQNATQENLTNFLFKNGVDIILGSHPHVLQPMEKRSVVLVDGSEKECFVIYSLGNFMSAQTAKNTRSSIILNISLTKNGYTNKITFDNISYVPLYMYKASSGNQKYRVLDIKNSILKYESGIDTSIGQSTYSTLKSEFSRIESLFGNGFSSI